MESAVVIAVWTWLHQKEPAEARRLDAYIMPYLVQAPLSIWLPDDLAELVDKYDFLECLKGLREAFHTMEL